MAFLRFGVVAGNREIPLWHLEQPFVTLSEGKGLAAQGEILRFAQNDKQLCHPEQPFATLSEGKGLTAQGGILRFAQNDRQHFRLLRTGVDIGGLAFL